MFLHKSQRVEGFSNKYNRREGVMGQSALSPSSPHIEEQGRGRRSPAAANPAVQGHGGGRERGGKEEGGAGARSLTAAGPEAARGGLAVTAGVSGQRVALGRRCRARRRPGSGKKGEEEGRSPVRPLPWAGATRGGGTTGAAAALLS